MMVPFESAVTGSPEGSRGGRAHVPTTCRGTITRTALHHYQGRNSSQLAAELSDEQIESFLNTAEGTSGFAEELRAARDREPADDAPSARGHLRAL